MVTVDAALEWIGRESKRDTPFLAVVWFGSPHSPHRAASRDRKPYAGQPLKNQHFLGEVTGMDRAFGKLRDALGPLGIRDNTILWYCSDNGALPRVGSAGPFRGRKGKIYEGGLLVPAILEWPARIKSPRKTSVRCNTCDIYPTLLEITGATAKHQPEVDGVSLVGLIDGKTSKRTRPMGFWDYPVRGISTPSAKWMGDLLAAQRNGDDLPPHVSSQKAAELPSPRHRLDRFPGHSAWIDGHWKLHRIDGKNGKVRFELYNLESDPSEKTNVAAGHPERTGQLKLGLNAWLKSVVGSYNGDDYAGASPR